MSRKDGYYLPEASALPFVTSVAIFLLALGTVLTLNEIAPGGWMVFSGLTVIVYTVFRWIGTVIAENESGRYNDRVTMSFRLGTGLFIFCEFVFFTALFAALFYIRQFSVPWLSSGYEQELLWNHYEGGWPTAGPEGPSALMRNTGHVGENQFTPIAAMGIPVVNTLILLFSAATVIKAYWGLKRDDRAQMITGLFLTVSSGIIFLSLQAYQYVYAYTTLGLTLKTGVYGATFFLMTGFHAFHVILGCIMLVVVLGRTIKGHFSPEQPFGFEGVTWFWLFLVAVWLGLFVFVYWM